ncbi:MAG: biotin/lipoyl-binding protein, partial [Deltaproteobacteria bacterium]|nr:biotin/lipoyl-binding protein [Deltaproteobacteria bacterium]
MSIGLLSQGVIFTHFLPAEARILVVRPAAPLSALVEKMLVRPGDKVKAGDVLAVLDTSHMKMELSIQKMELERLELQVPAERGALQREQNEERERRARQKEQLAVQVARVRATLLQDQAELSLLKEQKEIQEKLVAEHLAKGQALDELELRFTTLNKKVDEGKRLLVQVEVNFKSANGRLRANGDDAGTGATHTAPLLAEARAQKERVAQLEMDILRMTVRAPRAGVVGQLHVRPGDTAVVGTPLIDLHESNPRELVAYADEQDGARIHLGDRAVLTSRVASEPVRNAHVIAMSSAFEPIPLRFRKVPTEQEYARRVFLLLDDDTPAMLAGQLFDAQLLPPDNSNKGKEKNKVMSFRKAPNESVLGNMLPTSK